MTALPANSSAGMLEDMARKLEASGDYKVLRRLVPHTVDQACQREADRIGLVIDLETTGLDYERDEVIELGMAKFAYSAEDTIAGVLADFHGFQQPSRPIPMEVSRLTGITDEIVAGHAIDANAVTAFVDDANFIVAHNAAFDRRFAERCWPIFATKPWVCSMAEIDWKSYGFGSARLPYLLVENGLFHVAHRAVEDCQAVVRLLSLPLPNTNLTALRSLLVRARQVSFRIWAERAPFELKDTLRRRGYRWSDGSDGSPRAWYIDVAEDRREAEIRFLKDEIYQREVDIPVRQLTAWDRFSRRA